MTTGDRKHWEVKARCWPWEDPDGGLMNGEGILDVEVLASDKTSVTVREAVVRLIVAALSAEEADRLVRAAVDICECQCEITDGPKPLPWPG